MRFSVDPDGAQIYVDGKPMGKVSELRALGGVLKIAPGIYQVSLRLAGYETWRAEVSVGEGTQTIQVALQRKQ